MNYTHVFGLHAVQSALENNPKSVIKVLLSEARDDKRLSEVESLAVARQIEVQRVSTKELQSLIGEARHQGVVAQCRAREVMSEPQMLQHVMGIKNALVLVLDGVTDPHNLGAVLRTADAAGVDVVIVPRNGSAGLSAVVRKVASGAAETMPFCSVANLSRTLGELKELGVWFYGASDAADSEYTAVDYTGSVGLILGSEGTGLRRLTQDSCDGLISIPMAGSVSSLNVSVAAGVCLFEVVRQRRQQS